MQMPVFQTHIYKYALRAAPILLCGLLIVVLGNTPKMVLIPRKVLVFYDSMAGQGEKENLMYQNGQTILNYYGLLTEYRDINARPLPGDSEMAEFKGIITTFTTDIQTDPKSYLKWLVRQTQSGRKIVIIGKIGIRIDTAQFPGQNDLIQNVFRRLGFVYKSDFSISQPLLRYAYKDPSGVEFERAYPPFPPTYEKIELTDDSARVYLSIKRTDQPHSISPIIFTSPMGGYAHEDYIYWEDPVSFKRKWYLNPFIFFKESLSVAQLPIPDPTTLNGMRVAISHIDADGFSGPSRIDPDLTCAEIIRDRILKKYDFPVTVSVIVGEIDPKAAGNKELVAIAKEIYRLPNVEPASHSYSHPFYWDTQDQSEARKYQHQYGIKIPGYTHDPEMEIDYSMTYITETLSPRNKPCKILLWSGNCIPTESDIARCDALGNLNMNGGDTLFDALNDSYTSVAPYYRKVGQRYQIHTGQANENILTNLWTGPFYGYRNIITTMERTGTPRRICPIDIYYHFYSGEYPSSLKALQEVYDWVQGEDVAPIFTTQYAEMVGGYLKARIFRAGESTYIVRDYERCLTIRFNRDHLPPDMSRSVNVLGYMEDAHGLYVSLAPNKKEAKVVFTETKDASRIELKRPYVQRSSGWVTECEYKPNFLRVAYEGFGKGKLTIGGLPPESMIALSGNGLMRPGMMSKSNNRGILAIDGVKAGMIEMTW